MREWGRVGGVGAAGSPLITDLLTSDLPNNIMFSANPGESHDSACFLACALDNCIPTLSTATQSPII
jgi:hypothetical protein